MPIPFELRPGLPPEGVSAAEHGLGHSPRAEEHVRREAASFGRDVTLPDRIPNTHLAMVAGEFARDSGEHTYRTLHERIFDAYYTEDRDIGDRATLRALAEDAGLDPHELDAAWDEGRYEDRLHEIQHLASHLGVVMTPSAFVCDRMLVGSRPYGVVAQMVRECIARQEAAGEAPPMAFDSAEGTNG